ncbi:UDP-N-acetylmuramate:L-alanyl-gamma-D-glutamyl-meso-diaminopimelate ligase [Thiohalobacter sp. IOR34]|uniref:UDP-N-acetylmuramate:L-alanyl-gamma-D-glutamyl- meso-diaminopimelate ligase n=1 Tax=Thiohalobacter sp. IOR34 TaxID=3057176 RepID=UPI0025AFB44A|nr:UDP-N-acetylmuramate:L-alanyl-gamma-D-glutamyl-meso-diaminopimelate ligase [Thiohalobacter sp. IOR34]WJW76858.1 UDP-N-acetylmuramate:L-alanyl-gamma-D-glutamyl-meso-diaminopimelate ligase [Thiohalobacter sp. IOR34]
MRIHILGICGTFMGGIALLARQSGIEVEGSDANVYPPMSTQLEAQGIALREGYRPEHLGEGLDAVVIGNALSRGNPAVERVLDAGLPYTSGPQWLADHVLQGRWVLAVAGTHGKTSTASMLAWILEHAGLGPGFLIGGVPANFGVSARLGETPFFVVEADEYDTAFFDKRSKFVHYRPRTLVLNNLEFDHADIFPDLAAIQRQFHHLVRTVPGAGLIIENANDGNIAEMLEMGCWTPTETVSVGEFPAQWQVRRLAEDGSRFEVWYEGTAQGAVEWGQLGEHNLHNALAAIAAARHAGVPAAEACAALCEYRGVKRRMELRGRVREVAVLDDFAHHPTAIATTLAGLRQYTGSGRILAVLEPRSNTMRMGVHQGQLAPALREADRVWLFRPADLDWDLEAVARAAVPPATVSADLDALVAEVVAEARPGDSILVMSNGGFGGIHERLLAALKGH